MIGFETIGNATIICHDGSPILATDPWLDGSAYFGSWGLPYEIPEEQREHIAQSTYLWLSHGHPDHISIQSLDKFRDKKILLANHIGQRLKNDLSNLGFNVVVLEERKWTPLSRNISIMTISDYFQDSVLLVNIRGRLLININDAGGRGCRKFIQDVAKNFKDIFLFKLFGYGDADMINYFHEDGTRIPPNAARKVPVGHQINSWSQYYGARYVVPSSSFHYYQRKDSAWANQYTTPVSDYQNGLSREICLLPAFIKYDFESNHVNEIQPQKVDFELKSPEEFGDHWDDPLDAEDIKKLNNYFSSIESLKDFIDFINIRVGNKDHVIEYRTKKFNRGITFETPRNSLLTAINYQIFDDLLIGNFMKTTLHGNWHNNTLYPYFTPYVAKFADNGRAKTKAELNAYFQHYRQRSPIEFIFHRIEDQSAELVRRLAGSNTKTFEWTKKFYLALRSHTNVSSR